MRSVVVVFPASMWAMMPIFRLCSSGVDLGIRVVYPSSAFAVQFLLPVYLPAVLPGNTNAGGPGHPLKQGSVSIRSRRVLFATVARKGTQGALETAPALNCPASLFGKDRTVQLDPGSWESDPRVRRGPIGADAQPSAFPSATRKRRGGYQEPHNLDRRSAKVNEPELLTAAWRPDVLPFWPLASGVWPRARSLA